MAFCVRCGAQHVDDARFCPACGAEIPTVGSTWVPTPPVPPTPEAVPSPPAASASPITEVPPRRPAAGFNRFTKQHPVIFWGGGTLLAIVLLGIAFGGRSTSSNISNAPLVVTTPSVSAVPPITTTPPPPPATTATPTSTTAPPATTTPPTSTGPALVEKISGQASIDTFSQSVNGDAAAGRALSMSDVFCGWNPANKGVTIHIRFRNTLSAHVQVQVEPDYSIRNGGSHGNAVGDAQTIGVPAHGSYTWWGNAGSPAGVSTGAPISRCHPTVLSVSPG